MSDAKEQLHSAAHAVQTAASLIRMEEATIRAFLDECRDMESFGNIVDPTLYRDPERRAVSALMKPIFEAALDFLTAHNDQLVKAKTALAAVGS